MQWIKRSKIAGDVNPRLYICGNQDLGQLDTKYFLSWILKHWGPMQNIHYKNNDQDLSRMNNYHELICYISHQIV